MTNHITRGMEANPTQINKKEVEQAIIKLIITISPSHGTDFLGSAQGKMMAKKFTME